MEPKNLIGKARNLPQASAEVFEASQMAAHRGFGTTGPERTVRLEASIRRRDLFEAAAAIIVVVALSVFHWRNDYPIIMQIGVVIMILAAIEIVVVMFWTRHRFCALPYLAIAYGSGGTSPSTRRTQRQSLPDRGAQVRRSYPRGAPPKQVTDERYLASVCSTEAGYVLPGSASEFHSEAS